MEERLLPRVSIPKKIFTILLVKLRRSRRLQARLPTSGRIIITGNKAFKISPTENLNEGHTLQFLAEKSSVPVPKLCWAFIHRDKTYTVMHKVPGHALCDVWHLLSQESRHQILEELKAMVNNLRAIRCPLRSGQVSGTVGGPISDSRLPGQTLKGPFSTTLQFHEALVEGNDLNSTQTVPEVEDLFEFYRNSKHDIVLTHGDLSSLNIMVVDGKITAIIDWETAGWYPSYWEYTTAKAVNHYNAFWEAEIDKFLTPMPRELAMDRIRLRYFNWYGAEID